MDALSLIFPKKCLECNKEGKYICEDCLKKVRPMGWHGKNIYSVWKYEGVVRKAIIALKYKYATEIADEIVSHLNLNTFSGKYCLVPIPLHWYRKNFRGFNQAEVLGEKLAKKMNWDFIPDLLIRRKSTIPQVQLTRSERLASLHGVFAVNPKIRVPRHSSIILFDDVYTTGSTLREAWKVLRKAGIGKIWSLTIAR